MRMGWKCELRDLQDSRMVSRFSNILCLLVIVAVFIVAGCEQEYKEDMSVCELLIDPNLLTDPRFIVPDYAHRAMEATGGRQAWIRTKELSVDCVVTFYQPDGSFYLTEQVYQIYPWSNSILVSAEEPQGRFVCRLTDGMFSVLKGAEQVDSLPIVVASGRLAEAVLSITTAPVLFLDKSAEFTKAHQPVKIRGQWYYPFRRTTERASIGPGVPQLARTEAVFYQNRDNSLVSLIWLGAVAKMGSQDGGIVVCGYDYREVEKNGVWAPAKIEIFVTDTTGDLVQRLVRIELR